MGRSPRLRTTARGWSTGRPTLSVVVPVYNEQENAAEVHARTRAALESAGIDFELLFVDDGSTDATAAVLDDLQRRDRRVRVVALSRNFGHQAAISAGLAHARGRAVVVIDGDLQDPPELIPAMVAAWRGGAEVVYAVRRSRRGSVALRVAYWLFYRLWRAVSDIDVPLDSGDFGLMDRRVVDVLTRLPERQRFVRGLRTFVGFRQVGIPYDRPGRAAGRAKYGLGSLARLAVDGLVSFSGYPLRIVTHVGLLVAALALVLTGWVVRDAAIHHSAPRGWASTLVVLLFLGSVQMLSLGIVGEYVRRIFLEVKGRPGFIVRECRDRPGPATAGKGRGRRRPPRRRIIPHPAQGPAPGGHRPAVLGRRTAPGRPSVERHRPDLEPACRTA
jgi:dolichol-phosphate mannosyltransferase